MDALLNAVKELETQRAKQAEADGEEPRGQAPPLFLAILAAAERYIHKVDEPLYCRAYGVYRLMRHGCSLRFSDTLGLPPATLAAKTRGYSGALTRTKTSRADKKSAVLPIFLSDDAYVSKGWLRKGMDLWLSGPLIFSRNYFLPLPTRTSTTLAGSGRGTATRGTSRALFSRP